MGAQEIIQTRIAAQQDLDAIIYGQRTLEWTGGKAYGISREYGAPDWAIIQWHAAVEAAGRHGENVNHELDGGAAWKLRKAKKTAQAALAEAKAAEKALGGKRQLRIALAVAA